VNETQKMRILNMYEKRRKNLELLEEHQYESGDPQENTLEDIFCRVCEISRFIDLFS